METVQKTTDNRREQLRLFIALTLPEAVKDQVGKAQEELRRALPIGCVRWSSRGQFHLTLKFLGDVESERLEELKASLTRACESLPSLQLRAEGIGFFPLNPVPASSHPRGSRGDDSPAFLDSPSTRLPEPSGRSLLASSVPFQKKPHVGPPRVIWVGVRDSPGNLPQLQSAVEAAMGSFTREKPGERFFGHVTMGRVKDLRRPEAEILVKLASRMANRFFGEWTADKVEIISSELLPAGPCHTTLAAVPLQTR